MCDRRTGDVVYGEHPEAARHDILGGPFAGPRGAQQWIVQNHPSWRCAPSSAPGGEWNVLCDKQNYTVVLGKSVDPTRYWIMRSRLAGEKEARAWVQSACPSWRCDEGGACASGPRGGGDWAVVCSKSHGGIGLTRQPDPTTQWIFASGLRAEPDARLWVESHCPSWRCDRSGGCLPGTARRPADRPVELPPELVPPPGWTQPPPPAPPPALPPSTQPRKPVAGPATPPAPAKPAAPPSTRADCSKLREEYFQRCKKMGDEHIRQNCAPGRSYSGCALDVAGCLNAYITDALLDDYCGKPGYIGCITGPLNAYLGCLQSCNSRFLAGAINTFGITPCRTACQADMEVATKACKAGRTPPAPRAQPALSTPPRPSVKPTSPPSAAAPAASGRFGPMEQGIDRRGQDYHSFNLSRADPMLCQEACAKDARCKAYTYVKPGVQGATARCWLKHSVPNGLRDACCVSGVRQ
jgi:hypothetical protein